MRVHELAKELGVTSKELLGALEQMGVSGKSASSSVPEDLVPRLRASGGKATEAPKRREVRRRGRRGDTQTSNKQRKSQQALALTVLLAVLWVVALALRPGAGEQPT